MNAFGTALVKAGLIDASKTPEALARVKQARRSARANRDALIRSLFSARGALDKARKGKRSTLAAKQELARVQGLLDAAVFTLKELV